MANPKGASKWSNNLDTFLYLARTDEDISLLKQAIKEWSRLGNLRKLKFQNPLMKLMYVQNRTDEAFKTLMSEV